MRTIWCSCASITPASKPSSSWAAISSSVTLAPGALPLTPSSFSTATVEPDSSITNGFVAVEIHSIGRATMRATGSGYIWPSRFGTSSPKTIVA